jgi:undecaprenyl-diphosphatase
VAVGINRIISLFWFRERPFLSHRLAHPWINAHDASFPSDHASASFAIAFAVLLIDPLAGGLFLLCAAIISIGRLFIGAHYPSDVAAGFLVGLVSALIVSKCACRLLTKAVHLVERVTDPLMRPIWRSLHV